MNFTREPIIETIISPKDGYKLLVRNSKGENFEEHYVDAVEVVSFGRAFFFRSMERPKAFLVPVSDYEILEVKDTECSSGFSRCPFEKNVDAPTNFFAPAAPSISSFLARKIICIRPWRLLQIFEFPPAGMTAVVMSISLS